MGKWGDEEDEEPAPNGRAVAWVGRPSKGRCLTVGGFPDLRSQPRAGVPPALGDWRATGVGMRGMRKRLRILNFEF
ncbi:hypothetical protein NIES2130_04125 [Scytonema sp. HK-05]|nr:hypothetical protein NIES2130_04125 [Scytonema sp. HK-05]